MFLISRDFPDSADMRARSSPAEPSLEKSAAAGRKRSSFEVVRTAAWSVSGGGRWGWLPASGANWGRRPRLRWNLKPPGAVRAVTDCGENCAENAGPDRIHHCFTLPDRLDCDLGFTFDPYLKLLPVFGLFKAFRTSRRKARTVIRALRHAPLPQETN